MTQEKDLLIRDLCARLPYGVICKSNYGECNLTGTLISIEECMDAALMPIGSTSVGEVEYIDILEIKPYLRSMGSMTDKEKDEYYNDTSWPVGSFDWLNQRHFDYRHLIEKGLALEAPDGMYK